MPHADPSPGKQKVVLISEKVALKIAQGELWEESQGKYAGEGGQIELVYPNNDKAVSFDDGEWLRVSEASIAGLKSDDVVETTKVVKKQITKTNKLPQYDARVTLSPGCDLGLHTTPITTSSLSGLEILSIDDDSPCGDLEIGTVITLVDGRSIHHHDDLVRAIEVGAVVRGYSIVTANRITKTQSKELEATYSQKIVRASQLDQNASEDEINDLLTEATTRLEDLNNAMLIQASEIEKLKALVSDKKLKPSPPQVTESDEREASTPPPKEVDEPTEHTDKKHKKSRKIVIAKDLGKLEITQTFEKMHHGKRREDVDKRLSVTGKPDLEDLEFWDLRACSEDLKTGDNQVPLEVFYFGEMEDAGDLNTFKVNMIEKLSRRGIAGIVAPITPKEAGCMYPLIGIPIIIPWKQALRFGNLVFEDFGIEQIEKKEHGADDSEKKGGCAQQ